jgi:pyruvate/2-oxoglutarate dehydrogenase complex dihydrolipoamide dehydrogenase (E3) component
MLEFALMFRRVGAAVTILQKGPRLADREDEDVSEALREIFEEEGITVRTGTTASSVDRGPDGGVVVHLDSEGDASVAGSHRRVPGGRAPTPHTLALVGAGRAPDDRGHIPVNGRRETEVEGIWALGDVTGDPPFTHTSFDDFRIVRTNLLEGGQATAEGRISTHTIFTDPQLGRVGMTEAEARTAGRAVRVAKLPMSRVARAMEMDETRGFMKALVDADTDRILGAVGLGVEGGEVAAVLQTAMMGGLPYTALRDAVISHPTLAESLNNLFTTLD